MAATDEFTIKAILPDGTKYEIVATRGDDKTPPTVVSTMKLTPHLDRIESSGPGMALMFWMFAAATIGGALFVVTRRNLIAAVMGMVGSFLGIAAVYMMLYANFLAVVQMLVYAGAIMVLFVFVIMILNRPEDEPVAPSGRAGQTVGVLAIVYLVYRLVMILVKVKAPAAALLAPAPVNDQLTPCVGDLASSCNDWGSVKAVGTDLFNGGSFPFEAISILLLVAVVGAVAIARPLHKKDESEDEADAEAAAAAAHDGGHA
ncbi:MAG: NADH-quinone oxidoreductase subunit J [Proteobacteria bacterium]|nr:NADH-quinone oxidoreductase subunit J [Pseudomonadota bacterium]